MKLTLALSLLLMLFASGVWADEKGLICTHIKEEHWSYDSMRWGMEDTIRFNIDIANLRVRHFTDRYPEDSTIERPCLPAPYKCKGVLQTAIELVVTDMDRWNQLGWSLRADDIHGSRATAQDHQLNRETLELEVIPYKWGQRFRDYGEKYACRFSAENEIEDLVRKENERQIQSLEGRVKENEKRYREGKEKRKL